MKPWSVPAWVLAIAAAVIFAPTRPAAQRPSAGRLLAEQEVLDMMVGTSLQASRANDSAALSARAREAFAQGKRFRLIPLDQVPDDWMVVSPGGIGGGGAWEYVRERTAKQELPIVRDTSLKSIEALAKYLGRKFDGIVRIEAAGATFNALLAGAALDVPVLDACLSGRARPETQQQIPWINGIPSTPAALVTRWGDTIILDRTVDDYRAEDLMRAVGVASGGGAAVALNPMSGAQVKRGAIPGAISQAILLGKTVREAATQGRDPVEALARVVNGYRLFQGTVTRADGRGDRGFTWWDVEIAGTGPFVGHVYKIYVKNENLITWLDGKVDATAPDFIQNVNPKTGDAMAARELGGYTKGEEVAIVGWPSSPLWRTRAGVEIFGPRAFGFDFDYVPIEQIQQRRTLR
jgi:DUF917 family protein